MALTFYAHNLTFFRPYRWYNSTYTLFAVSILLTAVFHKFARTSQALDDIFGHIDRAIAVLQVMDECTVAKNAMSIIKRTLSRAKGVQQPALNSDPSSNAQESGMERSVSENIDLCEEVGFTNTISEVEAEGTAYDDAVKDGLTWLDTNPNPFDDCQQSLFWTTWAQEVDVLGE